MKKLLGTLSLVIFAGCAGQVVQTNTPASPARETSSAGDSGMCQMMIPEAMAKAAPLLSAAGSDLLSPKEKKRLAQLSSYQLVCTGKIENSVGYSLDRVRKILYVESDFQSVTYLTESPYAQGKIREYNLNIQFLTLHKVLVGLGAIIWADEIGALNGNYELFYKTLKKIE